MQLFLAVNDDDDYFAKIQGAGRRPKVPDSNTLMVARLSLIVYPSIPEGWPRRVQGLVTISR